MLTHARKTAHNLAKIGAVGVVTTWAGASLPAASSPADQPMGSSIAAGDAFPRFVQAERVGGAFVGMASMLGSNLPGVQRQGIIRPTYSNGFLFLRH